MSSDEGSTSLLLSTKGHRPTLTTLLDRDDLDAATSSNPIDLPSAPPLSHQSFAGDQFDPSEFLLERRHTGLDDLRSEVSELAWTRPTTTSSSQSRQAPPQARRAQYVQDG